MLKAVAGVTLAWAEIENAFVFLFRMVLHHHTMAIASAIWFAPTNLETRINIVDQALREAIFESERETEILAVWVPIMNSLNRLKATRNKVAHGQLVTHRRNGKSYVRLTAPLLNRAVFRQSRSRKQLPGVSAADLEQSAIATLALVERVTEIGSLILEVHRERQQALLGISWQSEANPPS